MKLEERIKEYLSGKEYSDEKINEYFSASVYIAEAISIYAHRNQCRKNGLPYFNHPNGVKLKYQNLVGIIEGDICCVDEDLMSKFGLPYDGVQEVCLLHDVLEDTDVGLEEIKELFDKYDLLEYFTMYIEKPLKCITHDDSIDYESYIQIVLTNKTSSIVKLMDLVDNLNILQLIDFQDKDVMRAEKYIKYCKVIEDKYHFIKSAYLYGQEYNKKRNKI